MTWIVTGASRGLGRHIALQLAGQGDEVLAIARDGGLLHTLADAAPGRITPLVLDLADATAIAPTMAAALAPLAQVSGLVNNAGIGAWRPFVEHSEAESLAIVQVNLAAAIQMTHAVLPRLLAQGRGHIVHVGSDLARRPQANMAVYAATKHGLAGFSHSLLREVKDRGVKVSLVNPGIIDTGFGGGAEGSRDAAWSLRPAELAALVVQVLRQPGHQLVDELTVHPLGQDGY